MKKYNKKINIINWFKKMLRLKYKEKMPFLTPL